MKVLVDTQALQLVLIALTANNATDILKLQAGRVLPELLNEPGKPVTKNPIDQLIEDYNNPTNHRFEPGAYVTGAHPLTHFEGPPGDQHP